MSVKVLIEADVELRDGESVDSISERVDRLLAFGTIKDAFSDADIDLNRIQVVEAKEVLS